MNVELLFFKPSKHEAIKIPTHYRKSFIRIAYKYDIIKCVYFYLKKKLETNEIKFLVDGKDGYEWLMSFTDDKELKKNYTIVIGKLIKQNKSVYYDYLYSAVEFLQKLASVNYEINKDIKILKVYVDEIIVTNKFEIKEVSNPFNFKVREEKIVCYIEKTNFNNKQLYIDHNGLIKMKHNFSRKSNIIRDAEKILLKKNHVDYISRISEDILSMKYPIDKLYEIPEELGKEVVKSSSGQWRDAEIADSYDTRYYYDIWRELAKYCYLSRTFL